VIFTRVIIAAAGNSTRWGEHPPKQLLNINGEVLICRTIKQLRKCNFNNLLDIILMAKDERFANYFDITVPLSDSIFPGTALGMSAQFWGDYNILLILGDVYFSDSSMDTLLRMTYFSDITFMGRLGRDKFTDHGSEIFAIWIPQDKKEIIRNAINLVSKAKIDGVIDRYSGWEVYKFLNNFPINEHDIDKYGVNFIQQLDETDDFDTLDEFNNWISAYKKLF